MAKKNAFNSFMGSIEVICGPMFAGKSEELLRRLKRFDYAEIEYLVFKPVVDSRSLQKIESRNGFYKQAIEIKQADDILTYLLDKHDKKIRAIAVDEAQFLDNNLAIVAQILADKGFVVLISGLDCDFKNEPFGPMPLLLAKADKVTKLTAICTSCGANANFTQRYINDKPASYDSPTVLIDQHFQESYAPRCRECYKYDNSQQLNELQKRFNQNY